MGSVDDASQWSLPQPLAQSTQRSDVSAPPSSKGKGRAVSGGAGKRKRLDPLSEQQDEPPYKQLNLVKSRETVAEQLGAAGENGVDDHDEESCRSARTVPFDPSMRKTKRKSDEPEPSTTTTTTATTERVPISAAPNLARSFPDEESFHRVPGDVDAASGGPTPTAVLSSSSSPAASGAPTATASSPAKTPTATVAPRTGAAPELKYTPINNLSVNSSVHIFGVVEYVNAAKAPFSSGRDWSLSFGVCDASSEDVERDKLRCIAFASSRETLPRIEQRGDIIRMHRLRLMGLRGGWRVVIE